MPQMLRTIPHAGAYDCTNIIEESNVYTVLEDINIARLLGCLHQLAYLSSYSIEIFDNLSCFTSDIGERIECATLQCNNLRNKLLSEADKRIKILEVGHGHDGRKAKEKYLDDREPRVPSVLTSSSRPSTISSKYKTCASIPTIPNIDPKLLLQYSNPDLFFDEWLRIEKVRQEKEKRKKKQDKERQKIIKAYKKAKLNNSSSSSNDINNSNNNNNSNDNYDYNDNRDDSYTATDNNISNASTAIVTSDVNLPDFFGAGDGSATPFINSKSSKLNSIFNKITRKMSSNSNTVGNSDTDTVVSGNSSRSKGTHRNSSFFSLFSGGNKPNLQSLGSIAEGKDGDREADTDALNTSLPTFDMPVEPVTRKCSRRINAKIQRKGASKDSRNKHTTTTTTTATTTTTTTSESSPKSPGLRTTRRSSLSVMNEPAVGMSILDTTTTDISSSNSNSSKGNSILAITSSLSNRASRRFSLNFKRPSFSVEYPEEQPATAAATATAKSVISTNPNSNVITDAASSAARRLSHLSTVPLFIECIKSRNSLHIHDTQPVPETDTFSIPSDDASGRRYASSSNNNTSSSARQSTTTKPSLLSRSASKLLNDSDDLPLPGDESEDDLPPPGDASEDDLLPPENDDIDDGGIDDDDLPPPDSDDEVDLLSTPADAEIDLPPPPPRRRSSLLQQEPPPAITEGRKNLLAEIAVTRDGSKKLKKVEVRAEISRRDLLREITAGQQGLKKVRESSIVKPKGSSYQHNSAIAAILATRRIVAGSDSDDSSLDSDI